LLDFQLQQIADWKLPISARFELLKRLAHFLGWIDLLFTLDFQQQRRGVWRRA